MSVQTHPSPDDLNSLLLGKLSEDRLLAVGEHVEACDDCQRQLGTLNVFGDTIVRGLRHSHGVTVSNDGGQTDGVLRRLEDIPQEAPAGSANPRREEAIAPAPIVQLREYRLLEKLGEGGMGAVYKALHVRLDKVVALKVLSSQLLADRSAVTRFEREMKAVGKLDHPHIVRAMDAGESNGTHYLVMEYVEGVDLANLLKRKGRLSVADACELVRQAALGLQAAHARGMVHRDVKPANLILAKPEYGPPVVKVLDLGLALLSDANSDSAGLTIDGHVMGTPDYMAPEQAGDSHTVDVRADVYSLGGTLYALLTGGSTFAGRPFQSVMQRLTALVTEDVPSITERRPDLPADLAAIVHRMMARDPANRYATPGEVASALAPFAAGAALSELLAETSGGSSAIGSTGTWDIPKGMTLSFEDAEPDSRTASRERPAPAAAKAGGAGNYGRAIVLVAAAALAGASLLGIILLSLRTPHGEVVVELADDVPKEMAEKLRIEVRGNGDLKVADAEEGWTIDVSEGKYTAQLAGGGDRFQLDRNEVTVSRDEKTFLRVTLKRRDGESETSPPGAVGADAIAPSAIWKPTAEQKAFFDEVGRLAPSDQAEAVRKKLVQKNPGFDGNVSSHIAGNSVLAFQFANNEVTEIWPVRALAQLDTLVLHSATAEKGKLADLSPLAGLRLKTFDCRSSHVASLSPLAGMPISALTCIDCPLKDLAPLRGMPLESLNCAVTQVSDLSPLEGMPLKGLACYGTNVRDLAPLRDLPLESLSCGGAPISDLSPLSGLPLTDLNLGHMQLDDLSSLSGLPLKSLSFYQTQVSDLSPLKGMPLKELQCYSTRVSDLTPLLGMELERLDVAQTGVSDLSPLRGMPLTTLVCSSTQVSDLSPVRGMALTSLNCSFTQVTDLSPLAGMPLRELSCQGVPEVSVLAGLPLERISYDLPLFNEADETLLRSLPIEIIHGPHLGERPANEYWPAFEARRRAAEEFAEANASLPPGEQVPAVTAELARLNSNGIGPLGHLVANEEVAEASLVLTPETSDLTPLRAFSQLKRLTLTGGTNAVDLSSLNSLPLEALNCSKDICRRHASSLREMSALKTINGQPAGTYLDTL